MSKKDFIFWFDFLYFVGVSIAFVLVSDTLKPILVSFLTAAIMPILTALNIGISASVIQDKKIESNTPPAQHV